MWLVGIHGGAGTSTLAAAGVGRNSGRRWPTRPDWLRPAPHPTDVPRPGGLLLVTRETASGLTVATKAAATVQAQGKVPEWLEVLGLVVVAAGPGKPAKIVRERLTLVSGWLPEVWRVPWVPELLATDILQVPECRPFMASIPPSLLALQELRKKK